MHLPCRISLNASPRLAVLLALAHGFALFAAWWPSLPLAVRLGCSVAVMVSLLSSMRRHALRLDARAVAELALLGEGNLELRRRDGETEESEVRADSTLFPWVVVVLLKRKGFLFRTEAAVILRDAVSAEDWRAVRIWLKWRAARRLREKAAPR